MTASNRSFTLLVFVAAFVLLLTGCASSAVLIGKARPAISPEQVKLYLRPPKKFEEIALLESSSQNSWAITSQGRMDTVIQRLKEEAASSGPMAFLFKVPVASTVAPSTPALAPPPPQATRRMAQASAPLSVSFTRPALESPSTLKRSDVVPNWSLQRTGQKLRFCPSAELRRWSSR